jgi:hypothetical protein
MHSSFFLFAFGTVVDCRIDRFARFAFSVRLTLRTLNVNRKMKQPALTLNCHWCWTLPDR